MGAVKQAAVARIAELRYWREEDARVVVEAWRRSGQGLTKFATQYGVQPQLVGWWADR